MNPRHEKIQRGKKPAPFSLGIDVGSATVACVMINGSGKVQSSSYLYHEGAIHQCLHDMLHAVPLDSVGYLGVNDEGREFLRSGLRVNNQVAIIEGAKRLCSPIEALLHVGAEKFGLILFDEKGRYRKWLSNTGCAAGTGSFLDQQAVRLALKDSTHLSEAAERFSGDPPRIATRCAVFAKTDLIHAQQKGYSIEAVCAGLCQGVARNILDTVTRGITLPDVVWISGGVALNRKVVEFIRDITGKEIGVVPDPEKVAAFGGASVALHAGKVSVPVGIHHAKDLINTIPRERHYYYAPLSRFPYRQT